jgi:hypothetical protein
MSFDNGPAMAQSPTVYRPPQSYPPPTPVSHHSQYDSGHLYGPPSAGPHMYPPLEIQSSSAKRKPQRASQVNTPFALSPLLTQVTKCLILTAICKGL